MSTGDSGLRSCVTAASGLSTVWVANTGEERSGDPPWIAAEAIATYLDDVFHELSGPNDIVRPLSVDERNA
jgi:hypothetical protein